MRRLQLTVAVLLPAPLGLAAGLRAEEPAATGFETLAIPFPFYNEAFGFAAG